MKKEKFNDIEALLSQETRLPQSLSKEEMVKKLKAAERAKTEPSRENVRDFSPGKKSNRPVFRIAASAAAFVVVAAGAFSLLKLERAGFPSPRSSDLYEGPVGSSLLTCVSCFTIVSSSATVCCAVAGTV